MSVATLAKPPAVTVCREGQSGIPRPPVIARPRLPIRKFIKVPATAFRADDKAPAQRWQHGQAYEAPAAPRMPSRIMRGVDALRFAIPPLITDAHVRAAERFANDYLLGIEGVRLSGGSSSCDAHDIAWARAKAVTAHNEVVDWITGKLAGYLISFLVEDLSFVAMSDRYWPGEQGRKEMRGGMVIMLEVLALTYAKIDRQRRRQLVKPPAAAVPRQDAQATQSAAGAPTQG